VEEESGTDHNEEEGGEHDGAVPLSQASATHAISRGASGGSKGCGRRARLALLATPGRFVGEGGRREREAWRREREEWEGGGKNIENI
jgi:hypothetical protein